MANQKIWEVNVTMGDDGILHMSRSNCGFTIVELLGLATLIKTSLEQQLVEASGDSLVETLSCNGKSLNKGAVNDG